MLSFLRKNVYFEELDEELQNQKCRIDKLERKINCLETSKRDIAKLRKPVSLTRCEPFANFYIESHGKKVSATPRKKVFVIGSLAHSKIDKAAEKYWAEGYDVEYAKLCSDKFDYEIIDDTFKKIKNADLVVAVMKHSTEDFGEGTLYEIAYARSLGKKVEVLTEDF